jgi:sphingomyelin phosphodiesterase acid-like 3
MRCCLKNGSLPVTRITMVLTIALLLVSSSAAFAAAHSGEKTVPALMVSDIHLDPFHDPAKVADLVKAPVDGWTAILATPDSATQPADFKKLLQTCKTRGSDTSYVLFRSSLDAMRVNAADAKFVTVSGDLIAHSFPCKYSTLFPGSSPREYQEFVEKTLAYVARELRATIPGVPIYMALGNNDTGCGDYRLEPNSEFLARAGRILAEDLPEAERPRVEKEFAAGGYFSVPMPAPMHDARFIVVNDLLFSPQYGNCAGKADPAPAALELAFLTTQLSEARKLKEKVWVMGHIPPGVDPYTTVLHLRDVCGGQSPVMFLGSNKLDDLLAQYSDVVTLAIFAHTHMDEMRFLNAPGSSESTAPGVPIKLVPSISPINGNNPSFLIARVNPATGILQNYEAVTASNETGVAATWGREYDYGSVYGKPDFGAASVKALVDGFVADHPVANRYSQAYIRYYYARDMSAALKPFWPEYACSLANPTAAGFAACTCPAAK